MRPTMTNPADPDEPLYFRGNDGVPGAEAGDRFAASVSA